MSKLCDCELMSLFRLLDIDISNRCDTKPSPKQYAAVDAYIDNMDLPMINSLSPGAPSILPPCCIKPGIAETASLIAILGTYSKCSDVVVFDREGSATAMYLGSVYKAISTSRPITITLVSKNAVGSFRARSFNNNEVVSVSEDGMTYLCSAMLSSRNSLAFYLDKDLVPYATRNQLRDDCMWISCFNEGLNAVGTTCTQVMPLFYMTPHTSHILNVNVGRFGIATNSDGVSQGQINSVSSRLLFAATRSGLCYMCAYMSRVHDALCNRVTENTDTTVTIQKRFHLNHEPR